MIRFHDTHYIEEIGLQLNDLRHWLEQCMREESVSWHRIDFKFCDEKTMLEYNRTYLDHDYYTDILTFADDARSDMVMGDILINVDRLLDNAQSYHTTSQSELLRLLAHGILHLIGYDDHTEATATAMRNKENQWIARFTW